MRPDAISSAATSRDRAAPAPEREEPSPAKTRVIHRALVASIAGEPADKARAAGVAHLHGAGELWWAALARGLRAIAAERRREAAAAELEDETDAGIAGRPGTVPARADAARPQAAPEPSRLASRSDTDKSGQRHARVAAAPAACDAAGLDLACTDTPAARIAQAASVARTEGIGKPMRIEPRRRDDSIGDPARSGASTARTGGWKLPLAAVVVGAVTGTLLGVMSPPPSSSSSSSSAAPGHQRGGAAPCPQASRSCAR